MIFLNSYLLLPLAFALLHRYFPPSHFSRISFQFHVSHRRYLSRSYPHPRLSSQSNSHYLSFLFSASLLFPILPSRFVLPLYCISYSCLYSPLSFFPLCLLTQFSLYHLLQFPQYTLQLARQNGFTFSACHTYIRRA